MNQSVVRARRSRLPVVAAASGHYRWWICLLLFGAATINYIDRNIISLLKPLLSSEFHFGDVAYGNIIGAEDCFEIMTDIQVVQNKIYIKWYCSRSDRQGNIILVSFLQKTVKPLN